MRRLASFLLFLLSLAACRRVQIPVTIFSDGQTYTIAAEERLPSAWLEQAGLSLGENDRLLYQGETIPVDKALPERPAYVISIRRAVKVVITSPEGQKLLSTSAWTVGEALQEAGFELHAADRIDPPASTPLTAPEGGNPVKIALQPAVELNIQAGSQILHVRSAAETVGQALAEVGLPLIGLDYSLPADSTSLPEDGQIRLVRVSEAVALTESAIPYGTRTELSADLELDQQSLLQGGETGLKVARVRTHTEDGEQVSQLTDAESIVRPPQDRVMGIGTKVVIRTATVDGVNIEYWRSMTVYATPYAPCVPETPTCQGGSSTSLGTRVRKGEVAMVYPWWLLLAHERIYVPGYGEAIIEDNNGANTSAYWGTHWIDLGYPDFDSIDWTNGYVTIYFLTPVPANIADLYVMP